MHLQLLHLDNSLKGQDEFIQTCQQQNASEIHEEAADIRLWGFERNIANLLQRLKKNIMPSTKPVVTFMGSGDFHHVTSLLLECILPAESKVTVIHFDNHPDWVHFKDGIHCGSWVNRANNLRQVEKVITIGVCSDDLRFPEFKGANLRAMQEGKLEIYPFYHAPTFVFKKYGEGKGYKQTGRKIAWKNIRGLDEDEFISEMLESINTAEVYITIDKDVLTHEDAITNWDQGLMRLPFLLKILKKIMEKKAVIGVDITGDYSPPLYKGPLPDVMKKKLEMGLDQPKVAHNPEVIKSRNGAGNLALLKLFTEALA